MPASPRARLGMVLAQSGCVPMILGGLGDQFVRQLLPAHADMVGIPLDAVPPRVAALVLALLHSLGYALMAVGIGALVLLRKMRASGQRQLAIYAGGMTLLAEGANALHMDFLQQPLFVAPLGIAGLIMLGLVLCGAKPRAQSPARVT